MSRRTHCLGLMAACFLPVGVAVAGPNGDSPRWTSVHGLLNVEVDENDKIFVDSGRAAFLNPARFTTNAAGQTILKHDRGGVDADTGDPILGGLAEIDGNNVPSVATASSTVLLGDDPGFITDATGLPPEHLLRVNFMNALRYFPAGGTDWIAPPNGEELLIFDLQPDAGFPAADTLLTLDGGTAGTVGTINIGATGEVFLDPVTNEPTFAGIHGHLGYRLSRPDDGIPAPGAYMIEFTLSAQDLGGTGSVLQDSEPIVAAFDNQLSNAEFAAAITAAEALPEPSTAAIVTAVGLGLVGIRRRGAARAETPC